MLPVPANLHLRVVVAGVVTAVVALVVLGESAPAHADIAIQPSAVPPGRIVPFTVQVMNDRAPDSTTRVELDFPSSPPIAWVDVVPIPRWSVRIERRALDHPLDTPDGTSTFGVSKVVWTGGPIAGGGLERFTIRVGPLTPDANRVVFKARQTFDSGHVLRWDDDPTSSTSRNPSPMLVVSRYATSRAPGAADPVDAAFNLSEKQAIDARVQSLVRRGLIATPDDIQSGRWIALVALLVAFAGLVFGVLAFLSTRRGRRPAEVSRTDEA
jgi:uncharacterized protein YcnI